MSAAPSQDERAEFARAKARADRTRHEDALERQLETSGLPRWVREYRFLEERRYRFDFAWPGYLVGVEVQGGIWMRPTAGGQRRGAHGGGVAAIRDAEKQSLAAVAGWRVLHVTPEHVRSGEALAWVEAALTGGLIRGRGEDVTEAPAAPPGERPWRRGVVG